MKQLRELFSDTLIYGISSVVVRFFNYLLVPFHTDVFDTAKYGIVGLVYAAISFLNVLLTFGMESAYLRYAENRDNAPHVFKTIQLSLLAFASGVCLLLWLFMPVLLPLFNLSPDTSGIFLLMIGILWFDTLSIVPLAELRLTRRARLFAAIKLMNVVVNLFLNFYLIFALGFGIEAVFIANLAASLLMTLLTWAFTADLLQGSFKKVWLRKAVLFGWPFVPSGIGFVINESLDRFLLNAMDPANAVRLYGDDVTPEDVVGIYNACYKLAVFMLLLVQMYRMAWQPFFMRHASDKDSPALFGQAFIWYNGFSAAVFMAVALFREEIVGIEVPILNASLINDAYWAGLDIVPFLLLAYWFHGWYINFSSGVFIKERTTVLYKITLMGAAITVVANLLLIPHYGMTGSAAATLISYGAMATTLGIFSKRVMHVPYRLPESFIFMGVIAVLVLFEPAITDLSGAGDFTTRLMILAAGFGVTAIYLKLLVKRVGEE